MQTDETKKQPEKKRRNFHGTISWICFLRKGERDGPVIRGKKKMVIAYRRVPPETIGHVTSSEYQCCRGQLNRPWMRGAARPAGSRIEPRMVSERRGSAPLLTLLQVPCLSWPVTHNYSSHVANPLHCTVPQPLGKHARRGTPWTVFWCWKPGIYCCLLYFLPNCQYLLHVTALAMLISIGQVTEGSKRVANLGRIWDSGWGKTPGV